MRGKEKDKEKDREKEKETHTLKTREGGKAGGHSITNTTMLLITVVAAVTDTVTLQGRGNALDAISAPEVVVLAPAVCWLNKRLHAHSAPRIDQRAPNVFENENKSFAYVFFSLTLNVLLPFLHSVL